MTAFLKSQMPNTIVTMEEAVAWAGLALHTMNPTLRVLESENISEYAASAATFTDAAQNERLLLRINLKLQSGWQSQAQKMWMAVQEFSNTELPSGYTS